MSTLVSTFCSKHKEQLDAPMFLKLTAESVLPKLSVEAALELLELEVFFMPAIVSADELSSFEVLDTLRRGCPCRFASLHSRLNNPLVLSKCWRGRQTIPASCMV